jgi:hypothetical protein
LGLFILIIVFLLESKEEKISTSTSFGAPKPKRSKVLTRRLKLQSSEQTAVVPMIKEVEFIESAKTVPAMPAEASADAVKEPEIEKKQKNNQRC